MWRKAVLVLIVLVVAAAPSPAAEGDTVLHLSGALSAAKAERFSVPVTDSWQIQLKWLIEEGVTVEEGEAIARFDSSGLEDRLAETEERLVDQVQNLNLDEAEGRLQRMNLELELKRAEVEHAKAVIDATVPEDTLKGVDYRERQYNLEETEKRLEDARIAIETQDASQSAKRTGHEIGIAQERDRIERFKRELEELVLRATSPGIVVHENHPWFGRKVREGDQLQATFPVASIPDVSTLEVEGWASEIDLRSIVVGQKVRMTLDAYPGRRFTGQVMETAKGGEKRDQWGRTPYFRVRIRLDERDEELMKPGMSVRCDLLDGGAVELASVEGVGP